MVEYDPQEKNLVRKLDYHIMPYLVLVFFCSHLVRYNLNRCWCPSLFLIIPFSSDTLAVVKTWNNVDQARTASFAATTFSPWAQISHWKGHDQDVLVQYEVAIPLAFAIGKKSNICVLTLVYDINSLAFFF